VWRNALSYSPGSPCVWRKGRVLKMDLRCKFSFITGLSKKKFTAVGESHRFWMGSSIQGLMMFEGPRAGHGHETRDSQLI
jgi:hypothetical protein